MAVGATVLRMAYAAGRIVLAEIGPMPLHPSHIMTEWWNSRIHVDMARAAILSRPVRPITDGDDVATLQTGNDLKILVQQGPMTLRAFTFERFGVNENMTGGRLRCRICFGNRFFTFCRHSKFSQLLFLMAHTTGIYADLFGIRLVMAFKTGFVRDVIERRGTDLAMAIAAVHSIILHMEIVAEAQLRALFFLAA